MTDTPRAAPAERGEVLVLHSAGVDRESVRFVTVPGAFAVDLPGHGDNPQPATTLEAMADEIAARLESPVHVVGLSLGGMVAQHLALRHPAKVRSLVLGCTTAQTDRQMMLDRARDTETQSRADLVRTTLKRWFTSEALRLEPEPDFVKYARERLEQIDQKRFAGVWRAIAGHDVAEAVTSIAVPTTCVAGSHDVSTPPPVVQDIHAAVPGSRYVEIAAPHMAYLEDAERFTRVVGEHLAWVTGQ